MSEEAQRLAAARTGDEAAFRALVAPHQRELRAYCYRMAGSLDEADDLVQESLLKAWRSLPTFEGRSAFRTWLYKVAFSACMDALEKRPRRTLIVDEVPAADPDDPMPAPRPGAFVGPCPPVLYSDAATGPEARYGARESVALAFLAALQLLPAKQRATLLACDVMGCSADECAELLGTTTAAVNSALQRARETLEARATRWRPSPPDEATTGRLLARYIEAWERADVPALCALLHEDATLSMPPLPLWLRGPASIGRSIAAMVLTPDARGRFHLVATEASGLPALAAYGTRDGKTHEPVALHLLTLSGDRIAAITAFLDPGLFAAFGLPRVLER